MQAFESLSKQICGFLGTNPPVTDDDKNKGTGNIQLRKIFGGQHWILQCTYIHTVREAIADSPISRVQATPAWGDMLEHDESRKSTATSEDLVTICWPMRLPIGPMRTLLYTLKALPPGCLMQWLESTPSESLLARLKGDYLPSLLKDGPRGSKKEVVDHLIRTWSVVGFAGSERYGWSSWNTPLQCAHGWGATNDGQYEGLLKVDRVIEAKLKKNLNFVDGHVNGWESEDDSDEKKWGDPKPVNENIVKYVLERPSSTSSLPICSQR